MEVNVILQTLGARIGSLEVDNALLNAEIVRLRNQLAELEPAEQPEQTLQSKVKEAEHGNHQKNA